MRKISKVMVAAVALGSVLSVGTNNAAASSSASALDFSDCPANSVCLWKFIDGQGDRLVITEAVIANTINRCSSPLNPGVNLGTLNPPLNDWADSIMNRTDYTVRFENYIGNGNWEWIATPPRERPTNLPVAKRNHIDLVTRCAL